MLLLCASDSHVKVLEDLQGPGTKKRLPESMTYLWPKWLDDHDPVSCQNPWPRPSDTANSSNTHNHCMILASRTSVLFTFWPSNEKCVNFDWHPKTYVRFRISPDNLRRFEGHPDDLLHRYFTLDEALVLHFMPETKQGSKQWKQPDWPPPQKAMIVH